jgi:hypothetical protein
MAPFGFAIDIRSGHSSTFADHVIPTNTTMLPDKKTKTNIGVGIGIILQILGRVLAAAGGRDSGGEIIGLILLLVGLGFFVWGCLNYSEGKGYSKWLGLLGLLSCIGLVILVLLPDKHKESQ